LADVQLPRMQSARVDQQYRPLDTDSLAHIVDSLIDVVKARYGGHVSVDQLEDVRACIYTQMVAAERLHQFPLTNADEPSLMFVAYDEEQ